ncbi:CbtA family protein [Mycobacterium camsae]|uniref:CbtA family protein n=1 Tax=Mycobacterium gordonae TaxID=1778 RepID=UPI00197CF5F0|nr:CbtA family protein [Mycobacterium gordonae]
MEKRLIARGVLAGALGAVLAFLFARVFAEPVIGRAIEFEGAHEHGSQLFSRGVQGNAGLGFGVLFFGIALGALFAVVFCVYYPRSGSIAPQSVSAQMAAAGFVAVYLVPFLKYPPNPPAVGQPDTIGARTLWYLLMVLASVGVAIVALWLARRSVERFGTFHARLLAAGAYGAAVIAVMLALPNVAEVPPGFPAADLYEFRLVSLGAQLVLWTAVGLVFALLASRLLGDGAQAESVGA